MSTAGKSAAATLSGQAGASAGASAAFAGVNAAFTGGDTVAADPFDTLAVDGASTLAADLGQGIEFIGKSAAEAV